MIRKRHPGKRRDPSRPDLTSIRMFGRMPAFAGMTSEGFGLCTPNNDVMAGFNPAIQSCLLGARGSGSRVSPRLRLARDEN